MPAKARKFNLITSKIKPATKSETERKAAYVCLISPHKSEEHRHLLKDCTCDKFARIVTFKVGRPDDERKGCLFSTEYPPFLFLSDLWTASH